jgi:hypothetical protein
MPRYLWMRSIQAGRAVLVGLAGMVQEACEGPQSIQAATGSAGSGFDISFSRR